MIRGFGVLRAVVLRAGELTGHGEDLFHLAIQEILALLGGGSSAVGVVEVRRRTCEHYRALGHYPVLIRGSFDPERWTADQARRHDTTDVNDTVHPRPRSPQHAPGGSVAAVLERAVGGLRTGPGSRRRHPPHRHAGPGLPSR